MESKCSFDPNFSGKKQVPMKQDTLIRKIFLKGNPADLNTRVDSSLISVNGNNGATSLYNNQTFIGNGGSTNGATGANGANVEPKTSKTNRKINCPCL